MDQAITWSAVLWVLLAIGGVGIIIAVLFFILSIIAEGFRH